MAREQSISVRQAAEQLGTSPKWIRRRIADGTISPKRTGAKRNGRYTLSATDIAALREKLDTKAGRGPAADDDVQAALAPRIAQLEADRSNLLAQVAWARAVAQEQQKALDAERERSEKLAAEVELQRRRVEALKALSAVDRLLGRHKGI